MKTCLFLLLFITTSFANSDLTAADVLEEIRSLNETITNCQASIINLTKELSDNVPGPQDVVEGIYAQIQDAEACLNEAINDLNVLKELYPDLFKSYAMVVFKDPKVKKEREKLEKIIRDVHEVINETIADYHRKRLIDKKMDDLLSKLERQMGKLRNNSRMKSGR